MKNSVYWVQKNVHDYSIGRVYRNYGLPFCEFGV